MASERKRSVSGYPFDSSTCSLFKQRVATLGEMLGQDDMVQVSFILPTLYMRLSANQCQMMDAWGGGATALTEASRSPCATAALAHLANQRRAGLRQECYVMPSRYRFCSLTAGRCRHMGDMPLAGVGCITERSGFCRHMAKRRREVCRYLQDGCLEPCPLVQVTA